MTDAAIRLGWAGLVVAAGVALARGLLLTTFIELSPQAQADAETGRTWLWVATATLLFTAIVAAWRWQAPVWSIASVVSAGPVGLTADGLGWIPLVALVVSGPLLLIGLTGVLVAPRRVSLERP